MSFSPRARPGQAALIFGHGDQRGVYLTTKALKQCIYTARGTPLIESYERQKLRRDEDRSEGDAIIGELLLSEGHVLIPFAVDGYGGLGPMARRFLYGKQPRRALTFRRDRPNANRMYARAFFFVTDQLKEGWLSVQYCPTAEMNGDLNTKPLQEELWRKFMGRAQNCSPDLPPDAAHTIPACPPPSPGSLQECVGDTAMKKVSWAEVVAGNKVWNNAAYRLDSRMEDRDPNPAA
ncbi:hypothetical protein THAOC_36890 [Thalassiosira oceanica]|uniref:Uncharacterized protein n=1 Tax=Thalassiosira oceanica TaxID=159749 RepID=K0QZG0_THAOC|nr:hypothetical protein THAOC_36890 [Thalassiosira oceanica]|eukprot:EJK44560.1 hypothetical protein THAOC_36890 [Thalassiosira oceanica]